MRKRASDKFPPRRAETVHRTGACQQVGALLPVPPRLRAHASELEPNEDFGLTRIKLVAL